MERTVPYNFSSGTEEENANLPTSVKADALEPWCAAVLEAVGVSKPDAAVMAHVLVETDLMGVDTHGILKLPMYIQRAKNGGDNPKAKLTIVNESAVNVRADGQGGYGQIMGWRGMELAIDKASKSGAGFVSVFNSNTLTANRIYAKLAADNGYIGICITNGTPQMAPPGGTSRLLGTSPWSIAVPGKRFPIMFDMACTVVGWTRLALAAMRGESIPDTWAVTMDGKRTSDVHEAMNGLMLPFGGHKGYALSVMAEILTGVLGGGKVADDLGYYANYDENTQVSHFLGAIRIADFMPVDEFIDRVDAYASKLENCPKAEGVETIYVPGQRSYLTRQKRLQTGIPLHAQLAKNLIAVGTELGIPFPA